MRRTGGEDIKSLAAMIIHSEKFRHQPITGTEGLRGPLRTRRRLRADAAVGKAGIKMLSPIVIFILPVLFIITLVPAWLSLPWDLTLLRAGRWGPARGIIQTYIATLPG